MIKKPTYKIESDYFAGYVNKAKGEDLISSLEKNLEETVVLFSQVPENIGDFKYAEDKWTVKQLLQHVIDTERIFAYRAMRMARKDRTPLPGFEEDEYAANDNSANLSLVFIIEDFKVVRKSTIQLFKSLSEESFDYEGVGSNTVFTPRIIGWMLSGHAEHHNLVFEDRYLKK